MTRSLMIVLLTAAAARSAPVPKSPPLDPFGTGYLGVYSSDREDLRIDRVAPDGPAERAGLQAGDLLFEVGPVRPGTFEELKQVVGGLRPGTRVPVVVKRGEKKVAVVIVLGERPENINRQPVLPFPVEP